MFGFHQLQMQQIPSYLLTLLKDYTIEKIHRKQIEPIVGGAIYFQTLASAIELNVFEIINSNKNISLEELTKKLNLSTYAARVLLLGLTTLSLVKQTPDGFLNTKVTEDYLLVNSPKCMVNIIRWQNHINYKPMSHFTDSLKAEKNIGLCEIPGSEATLYERIAHNPFLENIFQKAMEEISNQANSYLTSYVNFSRSKMIMDIGGGTGRNLTEIGKKFPETKGFVFDLPTVTLKAKENFKNNNLSDRYSAYAGNCFKDAYPNNPDTILFCHFMTIWSPEENQFLIQKSYDTLPSKGRLIVFNMISHDNGKGPYTAAMGSPYFITLATGRGMLYAPKDYLEWFKKSGFKNVDVVRLPFDHRVFIAEK